MSNSATLGEDHAESLFQKMARESAERASPAEEREAIFERLRDFESAGGMLESEHTRDEGVPKLGETPADDPVVEVQVEPFTPTAVDYDDVPLMVIPLAYPFTVDGLSVRSISLRPPRLDYIRAVASGDLVRADMIAEMAGLSVEAFNAMRWPDAERVLSAIADLAPDLRS